MNIISGSGLYTHVEKSSVEAGHQYVNVMGAGWWFGVVASGKIDTEQVGFGRSNWQANQFVHFWADKPVDTHHHILSDIPLSAVFIHILPDEAERILGDDLSLIDNRQSNHSKILNYGNASSAMMQITHQMLSCRRENTGRNLYLSARTFDLINTVLEFEKIRSTGSNIDNITLSPRDYRLVSETLDLVMSRLNAPLTAAEIASIVGISPKKLTRGFKAIHGVTLGAFVKQQRMKLAYKMLEEGALSVSAVAYDLGYDPAHFATEFKRLYNISPSSLISSTFR